MCSLRIICLLYLGIFGHLSLQAQNLVVNGSFENYVNCPQDLSNLSEDVAQMIIPTRGTTDYYNTCGASKMGVPKNFKGIQSALHGDGYAGLYMYAPNDYREYIQFEIDSTLVAGEKYKVEVNFNLAESSGKAIYDELYVVFTSERIQTDISRNLSKGRIENITKKDYRFIRLSEKAYLFDHKGWMTIKTEFEAKGFEKYILIGNFKNNKTTNAVDVDLSSNKTKDLAYYYLDNVSLTPVERKSYELNKVYVFDHVEFNFDNFTLTAKGKQNIEEVYNHLKTLKEVSLVLSGHTDDKGSIHYNEFLSSQRAKVVARYFVKLGFPEEKIIWKGYGERVPLVSGKDEKSRQKNRRVEFVITEFDDE